MAVSNSAYLKDHYNASKAIGAKVISSDFAVEFKGFESMWLLCKQFPWPITSSQGEIEIPMPLGVVAYQAQQIKIAHQGQLALLETVAGSVDQMLVNIISKGGMFDGTVYEGTPQKYLRKKSFVDAFMQLDDPDRDWENRSQVLQLSGTIFYHYFGDTEAGNSGDYR
jgi:hypothetical protein